MAKRLYSTQRKRETLKELEKSGYKATVAKYSVHRGTLTGWGKNREEPESRGLHGLQRTGTEPRWHQRPSNRAQKITQNS